MAADNGILLAGTVGEGIWRSTDGGETFTRSSGGMFLEADVRALCVHPVHPNVVYAGTNAGLHRSEDGGGTWQRLPAPFDPGNGWPGGVSVWSLLLLPQRPDTILVGVCPAAIYRSENGGATWEKADAALAEANDILMYNRVTCLRADPMDENSVWAGAEIGGVHQSRDGGRIWQALGDTGLSSADIHDLIIVPGDNKTLVAATNNDLNISRDDGETWQRQNVAAQWGMGYCRGLTANANDPRTLFLGTGNTVPGSTGAVRFSRDSGQTWQTATLSAEPNSTIWTFAAHPADPQLLFCASVLGYVYRSEDSGLTWTKCRHEFGEVRTLACLPA